MPIFSRKILRQTLGQNYLRDTLIAQTTTGAPSGTTGVTFTNLVFADAGLVGQGLYQNATIWHINAARYDRRVGSFNATTGGFYTPQFVEETVGTLDEFEVHSRIPASQKNSAIDDTLKRLSFRQEVGIPTGTGGTDFFSIEAAASPNYIVDVLDAYWFANPTGTLDRDLRRFRDIHIVTTGSGREIRVAPAPGGSAQLVLDAVLNLALGTLDTATINLPDDDRWLLAGAAAQCYNLIIQNVPAQNAGDMVNRRAEWARTFSQLSALRAPQYDRKVRLNEPEDQTSLWGIPRW